MRVYRVEAVDAGDNPPWDVANVVLDDPDSKQDRSEADGTYRPDFFNESLPDLLTDPILLLDGDGSRILPKLQDLLNWLRRRVALLPGAGEPFVGLWPEVECGSLAKSSDGRCRSWKSSTSELRWLSSWC